MELLILKRLWHTNVVDLMKIPTMQTFKSIKLQLSPQVSQFKLFSHGGPELGLTEESL